MKMLLENERYFLLTYENKSILIENLFLLWDHEILKKLEAK